MASQRKSAVAHPVLGARADQVKRDFLSLHDLSVTEMQALLALVGNVKHFPQRYAHKLDGKCVAMIFEKPSLRTRVTFEVGAAQLGAHAIYLAPGDIALGERESPKDIARNLARWVNALVVRTFGHHILLEMAAEASIPVINALSDLLHPCQALADVYTLQELKGNLRGLRLAYVGDGNNNVAHSLAYAAAKTGIQLVIASPHGYEPASEVFNRARQDAIETGASIEVVTDPQVAVRDADAVYTDVWTSMGKESEAKERRHIFRRYQVDPTLMLLGNDALFMHCLPAHRGEEVTDAVIDSPASAVLEQAENRLHVAKAVMLALMGGLQ